MLRFGPLALGLAFFLSASTTLAQVPGIRGRGAGIPPHPPSAAGTLPEEAACNAIAQELNGPLDIYDSVSWFETFPTTLADELSSEAKSLNTLSEREKAELIEALRAFDFSELGNIPDSLKIKAKGTLLNAVIDVLAKIPIASIETSVGRISRIVRELKVPDPPPAPGIPISSLKGCQNLQQASEKLQEYIREFYYWERRVSSYHSDLNLSADQAETAVSTLGPSCPGLVSEQYFKLSRAFQDLREPMMQLGLTVSLLRGSTSEAAELFTTFDDFAEETNKIAVRLESLKREARRKHDAQKVPFDNFRSNFHTLVLPAFGAECGPPIPESAQGYSPGASGREAMPLPVVSAPPMAVNKRVPKKSPGSIVWFRHSKGGFERKISGSRTIWTEHHSDVSYKFHFVELKRDSSWVWARDETRKYSVRFPISGGWCQLKHDAQSGWSNLYDVTPEYR